MSTYTYELMHLTTDTCIYESIHIPHESANLLNLFIYYMNVFIYLRICVSNLFVYLQIHSYIIRIYESIYILYEFIRIPTDTCIEFICKSTDTRMFKNIADRTLAIH